MPSDAIALNNGSLLLNTNTSSISRQSSNMNFGSHLRSALGISANVLGKATEIAAPFVPGASVVSAALHGAGNRLQGAGDFLASSGFGSGLVGNGGSGISGGTGGTQNLVSSVGELQKNMIEMNAYMLGVQNKFQQLNVLHTTLSNALKAKHDTEKNSISNIR